MSRAEQYLERFQGYPLYEVKWSDVLLEYRLWAEWNFRPSKILFGTEPEDTQEQRAKETWWRFVTYHRQQKHKEAA